MSRLILFGSCLKKGHFFAESNILIESFLFFGSDKMQNGLQT